VKARLKTECFICYRVIKPGMEIRRSRSGKFVHDGCGRAAEDLARNREQVYGGYTYAGRKPSDWRVGVSPSDGARPIN
jgi:hypothetical protein